MPKQPHADPPTALDALEGRASEPEINDFRSHLRDCAPCRKASGEWAALLDTIGLPPLQSAPAHALRRAAAIFDAPPKRSSVTQILASLVSDSWGQTPALAVRGNADVRHMRLSAADFDIHLRIRYREGGIGIWAQLLTWHGEPPAGGFDVVVVDHGNREIATTAANAFGEFFFDNVAVESRTVVLQLPEGRRIRWSIPMEGNPR